MNIYIEKTGLINKEGEEAKYKKMMQKNLKDIQEIYSESRGKNTNILNLSRRRMQHPYFTRRKSKRLLEEFQNEKQDTES